MTDAENEPAEDRKPTAIQSVWTQLVAVVLGGIATFTFMKGVAEPIQGKDLQLAQKGVELAKLENDINSKINEQALRDLTARLDAEVKHSEAAAKEYERLAEDCKAQPSAHKVLTQQAEHAKAQAQELTQVIATTAAATRAAARKNCFFRSFAEVNGEVTQRAALEASDPQAVSRLDALCTLRGGSFVSATDTVTCQCP